MKSIRNMNDKEKELKLKEKIAKVRQDLVKLQTKRKMQIGTLAVKHHLDDYSLKVLDGAFKKLAKELVDEHSK